MVKVANPFRRGYRIKMIRSIYYRDYIKVNMENLIIDLHFLPWDSIYACTNTDQQIHKLNNLIQNLFESYFELDRELLKKNKKSS